LHWQKLSSGSHLTILKDILSIVDMHQFEITLLYNKQRKKPIKTTQYIGKIHPNGTYTPKKQKTQPKQQPKYMNTPTANSATP
jgi:hypothetical protein